MEGLKEISLKIYNEMFENKKQVELENVEYPFKKFSSGVKYLDYFGYRFIEQNRHKKSEWGKKARQGHKIMWVIKGRKYMYQIFDGEFKELKKETK
ncbi:MAG: hypothetical protein EU552_00370 [Promethearchaeota archaeon]|nr:MAG: hypothetical protein EU552_00370 [Candidatus Lokiarchaeota archaeon]